MPTVWAAFTGFWPTVRRVAPAMSPPRRRDAGEGLAAALVVLIVSVLNLWQRAALPPPRGASTTPAC